MANGIITGTMTGPHKSYYKFWVEWDSTFYASYHYSSFNATAYLQRTGGSNAGAFNLDVAREEKKLTANGITAISGTKGIDTRNQAKVVIASMTNLHVDHDEDGYAYVDISASFPYVSSNLTGGTLAKRVALDLIDPVGVKITANIFDITQEGYSVTLTADAVSKNWQISYDGGKNWGNISNLEAKEVTVDITGLSPHTDYGVMFRTTKVSNSKIGTSTIYTFKTLPIYATDILVSDEITVDVGSSQKIEYEVYPPEASVRTIKAISQDTNIVTTDGDVIIGVGKGETTVTLFVDDGSNVQKTVRAKSKRRVSGITVSQREIIVPKSRIVGIHYVILPEDADDKSVIITSSDETIAKVENGNIVGVENGSAIITIETVDGGYKAEITATVAGEYIWHDYSVPLEILNASDVMNISSNIITIRNMLYSKGYSVGQLEDITAKYDTFLMDMFDIFRKIEYNLDVINDNDVRSAYYVEPKTIGEYAPNKEDIWRWIQILNDMYFMLTGDFGKWQYLLCTDGYPTIDGKRILLRGDFVG